jgi:hypothetical protein
VRAALQQRYMCAHRDEHCVLQTSNLPKSLCGKTDWSFDVYESKCTYRTCAAGTTQNTSMCAACIIGTGLQSVRRDRRNSSMTRQYTLEKPSAVELISATVCICLAHVYVYNPTQEDVLHCEARMSHRRSRYELLERSTDCFCSDARNSAHACLAMYVHA